jgi:hypothetical protein
MSYEKLFKHQNLSFYYTYTQEKTLLMFFIFYIRPRITTNVLDMCGLVLWEKLNLFVVKVEMGLQFALAVVLLIPECGLVTSCPCRTFSLSMQHFLSYLKSCKK